MKMISYEYKDLHDKDNSLISILGRELGPSGASPNQRSRWKHAFSPLKHV